jgi:hypothetical protein
MRTSTQYFYPLTKPFSAAELPPRREGEVVDYYVQDANGVTVVEYCDSREEAERIAAAMNGPITETPGWDHPDCERGGCLERLRGLKGCENGCVLSGRVDKSSTRNIAEEIIEGLKEAKASLSAGDKNA